MGWSPVRFQKREKQITKVASGFGVEQKYNPGFPSPVWISIQWAKFPEKEFGLYLKSLCPNYFMLSVT